MSSQDQRSELSTPTVGESSTFIGCNHHHQHVQSSHNINRLSSPPLTTSCDHICTCVHHHTHQHLPSQHFHTHNNTNFPNHNNINFGQQQHNNNNQNHNPNEVNQTNLELNHHSTITATTQTVIPTIITTPTTIQQQQHLAICHHYISVPNVNSTNTQNMNISTVPCECGNNIGNNNQQDHSERNSRILSNDENNPSGSEDCDKRKYTNKTKSGFEESKTGTGVRQTEEIRKCTNRLMLEDRKFMNRIEVYSDGADSGVKVDDGTSEEDQGPPLPPRPRPRNLSLNETAPHTPGIRKYVIWCLICGGTSALLGIMFLGVYFLLRSYTSSVAYFETVPTFVPATLLMLTGLCIMSLARRRNRYSYLIKLSGACSVASALTCALVTVTTTVLHLSRLQTLRQCEYTQKTRTCTCYTVVLDPQSETMINDDARFVFDSTADCGIVHGALYSCLRAVFGLSVAGVLVAVFSCMLVYQLLSHERKKMYWEQLELRCRSLYAGQPGSTQPQGPTLIGTPRNGPCRCCEQCHSHRNAMGPQYPWEGDNRYDNVMPGFSFWTPGQAGNFYSPNPGGDDLSGVNRGLNQVGQRSRGPGWSWPRMPWQRTEPQRFRQTPSSPDSQYGFSNTPSGPEQNMMSQGQQPGYSVIGTPPYGVWGPPPPYSDPNSPARRGRYQYIHPSQCQPMLDPTLNNQQSNIAILECHQHSSSTDSHSMEQFCTQQQQQQQQQQQLSHRNAIKRQTGFKTKDNYENTPSDSDGPRDRFSNTLPVRKTKKRVEIGAKSIGPNQSATRVNVQNVFTGTQQNISEPSDNDYHEHINEPNSSVSNSVHIKTRRIKTGVENNGFQSIESGEEGKIMEPSESEVYFADVSSCCNISVKNDNYYEDANQRRILKEKEDKFKQDENEDYLVQRFGKREASVRSRLPFPQMIPEDYEKPQMNIPTVTPRTSLIHKDISRQSMCSVESGEKTDFTDLSPATPVSSYAPTYPIQENEPTTVTTTSNNNNFTNSYRDRDTQLSHFTSGYNSSDISETNNTNFVASYPFSSNEQSQEAHRRSTKNIQEVLLAPDAQYELIKDTNQFDNIPLALGYDQDITSYNNKASHFHKPKSPKNLNITPIKRQSLGTNITAIIQNLGGSDVSLLYPDNRRESEIESQDCISKNKQLSDSNDWSDHSDRRL